MKTYFNVLRRPIGTAKVGVGPFTCLVRDNYTHNIHSLAIINYTSLCSNTSPAP
jgi:hypothetical protein